MQVLLNKLLDWLMIIMILVVTLVVPRIIESLQENNMFDWYTEGLQRMWSGHAGWVVTYSLFSGHFVDDFGNMVRVYERDTETGLCFIL